MYLSVSDRADFLLNTYKKKKSWKKILSMPDWEKDELEEMSIMFREAIKADLMVRDILNDRIRHLKETIALDYTWREAQFKFKDSAFKPIRTIEVSNLIDSKGKDNFKIVNVKDFYMIDVYSIKSIENQLMNYLEYKGYITKNAEIENFY